MKKTSVIIIMMVLLSACGNINMLPTFTSNSQPTSTSTFTPIPTNTPTFTPTPAINQTTHGYIRKNEIWQGEMHIIGDIIVERGVTLTIEPGTTIYIAAHKDVDNLFDDPFNMQIGIKTENNTDGGIHYGEPYRDEGHNISIVIFGNLNAVGTSEQMITITSDSKNPTIYDWNNFGINAGKVSYALIEYYRTLDLGNNVELSHSEMRHVGECAVCANSSGLVEENHIWDAGHELIDIHHNSPKIINNLLGPYPIRFAIILDGGSPIINGNTFNGCGGGILIISPSTPTIENNEFIDTRIQIKTP